MDFDVLVVFVGGVCVYLWIGVLLVIGCGSVGYFGSVGGELVC